MCEHVTELWFVISAREVTVVNVILFDVIWCSIIAKIDVYVSSPQCVYDDVIYVNVLVMNFGCS